MRQYCQTQISKNVNEEDKRAAKRAQKVAQNNEEQDVVIEELPKITDERGEEVKDKSVSENQ